MPARRACRNKTRQIHSARARVSGRVIPVMRCYIRLGSTIGYYLKVPHIISKTYRHTPLVLLHIPPTHRVNRRGPALGVVCRVRHPIPVILTIADRAARLDPLVADHALAVRGNTLGVVIGSFFIFFDIPRSIRTYPILSPPDIIPGIRRSACGYAF